MEIVNIKVSSLRPYEKNSKNLKEMCLKCLTNVVELC